MHCPDLVNSTIRVQSGLAMHSLKHSPASCRVVSELPRVTLLMMQPAGKCRWQGSPTVEDSLSTLRKSTAVPDCKQVCLDPGTQNMRRWNDLPCNVDDGTVLTFKIPPKYTIHICRRQWVQHNAAELDKILGMLLRQCRYA
jgi:hypothetical protein